MVKLSCSQSRICKPPTSGRKSEEVENPPASELLPDIGCPLLGLYGELDKRITDAVPAFAAALEADGKSFEHRVYRGAQHAFFNDTRPSFHPDATRDAFTRTLEILQRTLTGEAPLV